MSTGRSVPGDRADNILRSSLPDFQVRALFSLFLELGAGDEGTRVHLEFDLPIASLPETERLQQIIAREGCRTRVTPYRLDPLRIAAEVWACSSVG